MPQRREGLRPVFRLLGSLAAVLIPFGVYAYFYFEGQREYHVNRNFRALTEIGVHLSALLRQFESLFDFDPYNEIGKSRYPIRAIVEERFDGKREQLVVIKVLEALEDVESTEDTEQQGDGAKAAELFGTALKAVLNGQEGSKSEEDGKSLETSVESFEAVLRAALEDAKQEQDIAEAAESFRTAMKAALDKEEDGKSLERSANDSKATLGEKGEGGESTEPVKASTTVSGETEQGRESAKASEAFRDVLKAVLGETEQGRESAKASEAFRDVLKAVLGETEQGRESAKASEAFRAVLKEVLEDAERKRALRAFKTALEDALDKEENLKSLERSVKEESIHAIVKKIAKDTKTDLGRSLGAILQFKDNTEENLRNTLSDTASEPVWSALKKARERKDSAWEEVAKAQRKALREFTDDGQVKPYEGPTEREAYLEVRERIQSETLDKKIKLLRSGLKNLSTKVEWG